MKALLRILGLQDLNASDVMIPPTSSHQYGRFRNHLADDRRTTAGFGAATRWTIRDHHIKDVFAHLHAQGARQAAAAPALLWRDHRLLICFMKCACGGGLALVVDESGGVEG